MGLDDPAVDESGLTDPAPAPDPLKNAAPDVDQAKAAETGADRGPAGEEIDVGADYDQRAPNEIELPPDLQPKPRRGRGEQEEESEVDVAGRKDRGKVLSFLRACIDELGRVQWPDRKHVFQATAVVLGFVVIAGVWLGLMDALWQPLINALL